MIGQIKIKNLNDLEDDMEKQKNNQETQDSILQFDETYQKKLKNTNMDFGKMSKKLSPYIKNSFNAASPHLEQAYNAALPHLSSVFTPGLFQRGKVQDNNDTVRPSNDDKGIVESSLAENSAVENLNAPPPVPQNDQQPPTNNPNIEPPVQEELQG